MCLLTSLVGCLLYLTDYLVGCLLSLFKGLASDILYVCNLVVQLLAGLVDGVLRRGLRGFRGIRYHVAHLRQRVLHLRLDAVDCSLCRLLCGTSRIGQLLLYFRSSILQLLLGSSSSIAELLLSIGHHLLGLCPGFIYNSISICFCFVNSVVNLVLQVANLIVGGSHGIASKFLSLTRSSLHCASCI